MSSKPNFKVCRDKHLTFLSRRIVDCVLLKGDKKFADMDPMTRWISEGKADGPWSILDVVGNSGTCHLIESKVVEMEEDWSVRVEQSSAHGEETSTL